MSEKSYFAITINASELASIIDRLSKSGGKAHRDAQKRATKQLERYLIDTAKQKVNLKVARIKSGLSVNVYAGQVSISGRAPTLYQFLTPGQQRKLQGNMYREPKRSGLSIRYFKDRGRYTIPGSFLIRGKGGNPLVVRRKDKSNPKSKLEALYGRWTRDLWEVPKIKENAIDIVQKKYVERYLSTFDKAKAGIIK